MHKVVGINLVVLGYAVIFQLCEEWLLNNFAVGTWAQIRSVDPALSAVLKETPFTYLYE